MKGTLFSADFVKDKNDNIRLLELNTDTAFFNHFLNNDLDFEELHIILSNPTINELHVIHKPTFHRKFVAKLKSYVETNLPNITFFNEIKENEQNIFPANVSDADNKFILRLAYDAMALFDSEYCANTLNPLKLFVDNQDSGSITELYHSSSLYGLIDTLSREQNPENLPDLVLKKVNTPHFSPEFAKVSANSDNVKEDFNQYIGTITNENVLIQTYHISQESIDIDRNFSYRGYFIIYGSNLDTLSIGITKWPSILSLPKPEDLTNEIDPNKLINVFNGKHYYEFATNTLNDHALRDGLYETELVTLSNLEKVPGSTLKGGDEIQSYIVGGDSPNTDDYVILLDWFNQGDTLPENGLTTKSTIFNFQKNTINSSIIYQITLSNGQTVKSSMYLPFLCYEASTNTVRYKQMHTIEVGDSLFDINKNKILVLNNEILILNDSYTNFVSVNIEDADVYVATESNVLVHNSPCFVAGTKIKLANSTEKNIEDVVIGDVIKTYNHRTNQVENNNVLHVIDRDDQETVLYTLSNGKTLEATLDHPICVKEKGYSSFDPELSWISYNMKIKQIVVGDLLENINNEEVSIVSMEKTTELKKVYNLSSVANNHNFYANDILVHNRVK
jgi:hypothetical protein